MTRTQSHLRLIRGADGLARVAPGGAAAAEAASTLRLSDGGRFDMGAAASEKNDRRRHAREKDLLMPSEVAAMFRVSPKTVARWTKTGKLAATRTQGGHHRFRRSDVLELLRESGLEV